MTGAATPWRRRDDALWRRSVDAVVLLPAGAADPVVLPGTAAAVWDLLATPVTLADLVAALGAVYSAAPDTIAAEVAPLLARLADLAAIEPA